MKNSSEIINHLSLAGYKKTKVREAIIAFLSDLKKPIDALSIQQLLTKKKLAVNKSTVYREIHFLESQGIIVEINFGDGKKHYEIAGLPHHHHAVCISCHKVEDIFLENDLANVERKIAREKSFTVQSHSLEFFGLCKACL